MVNQWYKLTNQLNKIKNDCKCLSFHTIMNVLKTQFNQTKIKLQTMINVPVSIHLASHPANDHSARHYPNLGAEQGVVVKRGRYWNLGPHR